ncbi:heme exporter protein CcmD [Nissabacter sp. SGAir0207]|uniref:heme exporter protein CcmD n=1 Tax=Nissabacter sp. SGAir0207 TaxID=2126321 RepID=UPI0010CCDEA3|nr:heme exporter protein CcmD [Nissabacter sp. SGAir0207]QCR35427.1 heme exporter protein CcmD [Nissabacter sp. SGAir0207]
MSAAFPSWHAFFAMGGYAFYVWLSVAVTLLALLALVLHTVWQRHRLIDAIRRREARAARIRHARDTPAQEGAP